MHRYRYDANNRLEAVFTSSDGYIWDEDARYLYYAHGPMARVELGEYKVQGVDYYYTLQGWIKGVNLQGDHDAEATNNVQKYVSKDAFGYALHYYQNDYQSITGGFSWNSTGATDLFNGNIAAMKTGLKTGGEQTMLYRYDQLNRIKTAVSSQNTYQTGYSYDANGNILSLLRNDHNNATIDNLSYTYNTTQNNRLNQIRDTSGDNTGLNSSPTPFSYQYDNIGNLIEDEEKEIGEITWTVYGKVQSVEKNDSTMISYKYDAIGNRIYKKVNTTETHYVRDASGNLMATYENKIAKDFVIYGSSRIGVYNGSTQTGKRTLGNKKYELSNHLGNVLSVITDNKIGIDSDIDLVADYYEPYIVSESDYYPFGMQMQDRSFQNQDYLFAFQGQETNEEIGTVHYKYREVDIITGRFWSVDPLAPEYPFYSPFAFSGNRVIDAVELEGLEPKAVVTKTSDGTYQFTDPAIKLLSWVSGVSENLIRNSRVRKRAKPIGTPWFSSKNGGGGLTSKKKIRLTPNFFTSWKHKVSSPFEDFSDDSNYSVYHWLDLNSHEVGHLTQAEKYKSNFGYYLSFVFEYGKAGGHDSANKEKEAEKGAIKFRDFDNFLNKRYGNSTLANLFNDKSLSSIDKNKKLDEYFVAYEVSKMSTDDLMKEIKLPLLLGSEGRK